MQFPFHPQSLYQWNGLDSCFLFILQGQGPQGKKSSTHYLFTPVDMNLYHTSQFLNPYQPPYITHIALCVWITFSTWPVILNEGYKEEKGLEDERMGWHSEPSRPVLSKLHTAAYLCLQTISITVVRWHTHSSCYTLKGSEEVKVKNKLVIRIVFSLKGEIRSLSVLILDLTLTLNSLFSNKYKNTFLSMCKC